LENKEQIAEAAEKLFMSYGIRSVTMDDIAKQLGISKKTIYQHYNDKDEVVCQTTWRILEREKELLEGIRKEAKNAVHELHLLTNYVRHHIVNINPSALFDIQKYHKEAWKIYLDFKDSVFIQNIEESIKRGIAEGYFRSNLNPKILAKLRIEQIHIGFDDQIFPKDQFDWTEVQLQLFENFFYGLLTPTGKQLFENYSETLVTNVEESN
jgi:AcrR family transcriptional regulator